MFRFTSKLLINYRTIDSKLFYTRCVETIPILDSPPKNEQSLTVSYLSNSCGLSLQRAISATKYVHIENTDKPNLVLELLKAHGFANSQITRLISKHPQLILSDPEKTLKPKIQFLESLGIARADLPKILCLEGQILLTSLKNKILPTIDYLREILESDEKVLYALKRCPRTLRIGTDAMVLNIDTLRAHGVPKPNIRTLIILDPLSILLRVDLFEQVVRDVKEMGFEPKKKNFVYALRSMSVMSKSLWESKKELLLGFGWSEKEFLLAFRLQPMFMLTSEKKMKVLMEFFTTELSLKPSDIVKCPNLFLASLEKRIIPRCSALKLLMSKGKVSDDVDFVWALFLSKERFEKTYITCFKQEYPELIEAYQV
ncbi:transcription termination factor MTERF5, chloroplastic-like [Mercurialis annua]|uniref:transcription termination factor MTERF5, chloroplastic-like n=1 Tax=Mercurialis annua TaxID=3986 RepID=UPI00215FC31E|nr:transcription termination factor MTERF5, chloroplastic-like [Mercurialis annua]